MLAQVSTIKSQLDPFNAARGEDHLAFWGKHNEYPSQKWWHISKPPPLGPVVEADIGKCLNVETLHLSRRPITQVGIASWTILLAVFHPHPSEQPKYHNMSEPSLVEDKAASSALGYVHDSSRTPSPLAEKPAAGKPWHKTLNSRPLVFHRDVACTEISRMTLISFILLSQAREIYRYDGAAGLRMGFASYNGFYQIEWPIGQRPTLKFEIHEVYQSGKDSFPICFARRPRKCNEMAVGMIDRGVDVVGKPLKVAFAGRKKPGLYVLKLLAKRFGAQRSAADLYNMLGGEAHGVDYLFREQIYITPAALEFVRELVVPSLVDDKTSNIYVGQSEVATIADCLDHLPWSPLAWSIHRGMKDTLVAYALPFMVAHREPLAKALHDAVTTHTYALRHRGWEPTFVRDHMAQQAASAIRGDNRCSGDVCRIVAAITELLCDKGQVNLDHTKFWAQHLDLPREQAIDEGLSPDTMVALVKAFFVWWSHEFDYEVYHKLPLRVIVM